MADKRGDALTGLVASKVVTSDQIISYRVLGRERSNFVGLPFALD